MSLLSFLATVFCGSVVLIDDAKKDALGKTNKANAITKGKPIYWDGHGNRWRSTETDEIVFHSRCNHKDEDIGIHTHQVYKCIDHRKNWEDRVDRRIEESNKELENVGMNFYWERMPAWDRWTSKQGNIRGYAQIDKENGKPIWSIVSYDNKKTYSIQYAKENSRGIKTIPTENGKRKFDCRTISRDEYYNKYYRIQNER